MLDIHVKHELELTQFLYFPLSTHVSVNHSYREPPHHEHLCFLLTSYVMLTIMRSSSEIFFDLTAPKIWIPKRWNEPICIGASNLKFLAWSFLFFHFL